MSDKPNITIMVNFTNYQMQKLERLAKRKRISVQQVLRNFANSCKPDGGSWKHPSMSTIEKETIENGESKND